MNRLQSLWQMLKYLALSAFCCLALYGTVLAQKAGEAKKESQGAWTLPYFLAIMGVVLGMLILCRPSRRRERAKPEDYEDVADKRLSQAEMLEEEMRKKREAEAAKKL